MQGPAEANDSPSRARILAAAEERFAAFGYRRTGIAEIARDAGVAPGTLYRYFENKEEIFRAVMREGLARWLETARRVLAQPGTALDRLARLGQASVDYNRENALINSVAPVDGVDERVLAVVVDARLAEAREAVERRPGLGEDPARRLEPAGEALPHDGAEDLLLVLEVAVERPRGDARVAGDLRDAGAPVAEGGEALLGGGQDAGPGRGVARLGRILHEVNF